jgi:hypothetical protein
MEQTTVWLMVVLATILSLGMTARQPRWEVSERSGIGAAIHWFSLAKGNEIGMSIRQLYFGTGGQFRDAGYMVPNDCIEKLCCVIVAVSQITTINSKGESVWMTCLMTQGCVGDLYLEAMKGIGSGSMLWIPESDLMVAPNAEQNMGDKGNFDSVQSKGTLTVGIRHDEHPQNPARSVYVMTDWKA